MNNMANSLSYWTINDEINHCIESRF